MFLDRTVNIIRSKLKYTEIVDTSLPDHRLFVRKKLMRLNATAEIRGYIAPAEIGRLLENKGEMLKLQQLF